MNKDTLENMATFAFLNLTSSRAELFTAAEATITAKQELEAAKHLFDRASIEVDTVKTLLRIAELQ